jgi:hypothetical protein
MRPIVYVIPLIARQAAKDWDLVSRLCRRTVQCLLSSSPNVRVILTCNDRPDLRDDPRLRIIQRDFPLPQSWTEGHIDKYRKIQVALVAARQFAPCWLMKVDADDLVSRRVPDFLGSVSSDCPGVIFETGYVHQVTSPFVKIVRDFDMVCGTSNILRIGLDDLPLSEEEDASGLLPMRLGHHITRAHFEGLGMPLIPVPFPAAVYTVEHGGNHGGVRWLSGSRRARIKQLFSLRIVTKRLQAEFLIHKEVDGNGACCEEPASSEND